MPDLFQEQQAAVIINGDPGIGFLGKYNENMGKGHTGNIFDVSNDNAMQM